MKIKIKIVKSNNKVPGGLGAKLKGSMKEKHKQVADMHNVSVEEIEAELQKGTEVEMEHTSDKDAAHEIAMDHLIEDPKYYSKLDTIEEGEGKKDACYHKVRARYDVWPSAYASGALVKCRKVGAKNWGNSKKKNEGLDEVYSEKQRRFMCAKAKEGAKRPEGLSQKEAEEMCKGPKLDEKKKLTHKPSSESSLHDWFGRKGEKGKKKGWVDCNSPDGDGGYKSCGREEGEKRSKYPSCRPTPSSCKKHKGTKGKSWGKKSAKGKK